MTSSMGIESPEVTTLRMIGFSYRNREHTSNPLFLISRVW